MPHIAVKPELPGIRSLFVFRPETAGALLGLAETLLRGPSPLAMKERELIAAFVSHGNKCVFCTESHAAAARAHYGADASTVDAVLRDLGTAPIADKLRALLRIADKVREGGKNVSTELVEKARAAGANDVEIHDTVLIAAAFCMFNRYVDGHETRYSPNPADYVGMGKELAEVGYAKRAPKP